VFHNARGKEKILPLLSDKGTQGATPLDHHQETLDGPKRRFGQAKGDEYPKMPSFRQKRREGILFET